MTPDEAVQAGYRSEDVTVTCDHRHRGHWVVRHPHLSKDGEEVVLTEEHGDYYRVFGFRGRMRRLEMAAR